MKNITISIMSIAFLLIATLDSRAQEMLVAQTQTLESTWTDGYGFTNFTWLRSDDNRELYSSTVYLSLSGNSLDIYNTYSAAPLGHLARCGGLGCDLGKGQLLASVEFTQQNDGTYFVTSASDKADFLQGASCAVNESFLPVLECFSSRGPGADISSIFRFLPGT